MKKYKSKFEESVFHSKYSGEIGRVALEFLNEIEKHGGTSDDAVASFCLTAVTVMLHIPSRDAAKVISNSLKHLTI